MIDVKSSRLDSRFLPLVLDVVNHGIFTVDHDRIITSFNRAAEIITGHREEMVLGHQCAEIFKTSLCHSTCPLQRSIDTRHRIADQEVEIQTRDGRIIPISVSTAPLQTKAGKLIGGVEIFTDLSPLQHLRRRLEDRYRFDDIISKNPQMHRIFRVLPLAAESHSTVLVTGPSGSGKELVAKALHNQGPRRRRPFVAVNCAALPDTLLESELFGYRKGAFTDAQKDKPGRIAQAEGGTLFIDEIAELPRPLQVKLLRFLQDRVYEPLGATSSIQADVRVIAATNRNLETMVADGSFREDLYYRLNVLEITLPPLHARQEDIPLLVRHFIDRFRLTTGKHIEGLTTDAMATLLRYSFPGNVRELENIIERAFILCQSVQISSADLPSQVASVPVERPTPDAEALTGLDQVEREALYQALTRHGGNRTHAAGELGIHRSTLIRKLKRYGVQ
ncbi:MAG: sigma 54-interacting transcriptional regulator [bacterium]